jgi:hypothetical protein
MLDDQIAKRLAHTLSLLGDLVKVIVAEIELVFAGCDVRAGLFLWFGLGRGGCGGGCGRDGRGREERIV